MCQVEEFTALNDIDGNEPLPNKDDEQASVTSPITDDQAVESHEKSQQDPQQQHTDVELDLGLDLDAEPGDTKPCCMMPWYCVVLPWTLIVLCCVSCASFTILYTFDFGLDKSVRWFKSFIMSIFVDVIVNRPCFVILCALIYSLLIRRSELERLPAPEADEDSAVDDDDGFQDSLSPELLQRIDLYKHTHQVYAPPPQVMSSLRLR